MLTFPTRAGMFMELVAKPIPNAMADSMPKNSATCRSSFSWMLKLPIKKIMKSISKHFYEN